MHMIYILYNYMYIVISLIATHIPSECKVFSLYYLPAVLGGIFPDKFLSHALILRKAIKLLVGKAVSYTEIDIAEKLLHLFWRLTEKFCGQLHGCP